MVKGELPIALYWVMVAVVLGIYIWVLKTVDLGFYILFGILVILGIGYSIVTGTTTSFFGEGISTSEIKKLSRRLDKLEEKVDELKKMIEELKKLFEE